MCVEQGTAFWQHTQSDLEAADGCIEAAGKHKAIAQHRTGLRQACLKSVAVHGEHPAQALIHNVIYPRLCMCIYIWVFVCVCISQAKPAGAPESVGSSMQRRKVSEKCRPSSVPLIVELYVATVELNDSTRANFFRACSQCRGLR